MAAISRNGVSLRAGVAAGCLAPPIDATVGYNLNRRSDGDYGQLERRLVPPSIGVKSWSGPEGNTVVAADVCLLTFRF